jgi:hypothetical protein
MPISSSRAVHAWQEQAVDKILLILMVVSPIGAISLANQVFVLGRSKVLLVALLALMGISTLWPLRKKIPADLKVLFLLIFSVLIAAASLGNSGLTGSGPVISMIAAITAVMWGARKAVYATSIFFMTALVAAAAAHWLGRFPESVLGEDTVLILTALLPVLVSHAIVLVLQSQMMQNLYLLNHELNSKVDELELKNVELQDVLNRLQEYEKILHVCSWCKKVESAPGTGKYVSLDEYMERQTDLMLSHGLCRECEALEMQDN